MKLNLDLMMALLIWVAAPFVELGVIVALAVINSRHKRKIRELTERLKWHGPSDWPPDLRGGENGGTETAAPAAASGSPAPGADAFGVRPSDFLESSFPAPGARRPRVHVAAGSRVHAAADSRVRSAGVPKTESGFFQSTAALVIGVVFVILAGLIFATTAWHVLPSVCKVIMVMGFSALFFGASRLAGTLFKIRRTSQAFYILGSVFLFLTVLAAGYFGFLGPGFMLLGENRWSVLWAGSVATELALFAGLGKFGDRIYTQACLWGMTVSVSFLMGAMKLGYEGCANGMVCYAFLLVSVDYIQKRRKEAGGRGVLPEVIEDDFGLFAPLHFWVFGGLTALRAALGFPWVVAEGFFRGEAHVTWFTVLAFGLTAAGTALMALRSRKSEMMTVHSLSLAVFFQYAGFGVPVDFTYQLLIGAGMMGGWFLAERWVKLPLCNIAGGGILTAGLGVDGIWLIFTALAVPRLSQEYAGCQLAASVSAMLLAVVAAQWGREYPAARELLPFALFPLTATGMNMLNHVWGLGLRYDWAVMAYILAVTVWDIMKKDQFSTGILIVGTGAQLLFWMIGYGPLPFFLLLAVYLAVKAFQTRGAGRSRRLKGGCLYSLAGVHIIAAAMTENRVLQMTWVAAVYAVEYAAAYAVEYAAAYAVEYAAAYAGKYAAAHAAEYAAEYAAAHGGACPKIHFHHRHILLRGIFGSYSLEEARRAPFIWTKSPAKWNPQLMESNSQTCRDNRGITGEWFWNVTGLSVFLLTMASFYMDRDLALWNLVPCLAMFPLFYVMLYRSGHMWLHFAAALALLPVPGAVAVWYEVTDNQLYGVTAAFILLSGLLARWYCPIVRQRDSVPVTWEVDWFQVLAAVDLAVMTMMAGKGWQWVYIALIALNVLQYAALASWRKQALTLTGFLMALAYWRQPLIRWPALICLEAWLAPMALFTWLLAYIWKGEKMIPALQTVLYSLCLAALAVDAFFTGKVGDALILEGICLAVFLWANLRKCTRWVCISGAVIITVALYMTKDFWLSLSWWVYLLAAGLGLILFAAANEMKKH